MVSIERHAISSATLHMGATDWLKQELLMHDKIALLHLQQSIAQLQFYGTPAKARRAQTYEILRDGGVIYEPEIPIESSNKEVKAFLSAADAQHRELQEHLAIGSIPGVTGETVDAIRNADYRLLTHLTRAVAADLQHEKGVSAIPLLDWGNLEDNSPFLRKSPVLHAVVRELPIPDDAVPFKEILQLRLDPEYIDKRNRLWAWIRKLSLEGWTEQDIREEIHHLTHEYEKYMRLNGIKFERTSFAAVVKFGAGIIEDTLKFNFKDLAESLFSITSGHADLAMAEMTAPGREIALIPYLRTRLT